MKLIHKISIYFLLSLLLVLGLGTTFQYFIVNKKIQQRVEKTLIKEKKLLVKQILDKDKAEGFKLYKTEASTVQLSPHRNIVSNTFQKEYIFDEEENENLKYLVLNCRIEANDYFYDISIKKPLLQSNDLVSSLILSFTIILSILLTIILLFNHFLSKKIFSPFYQTIEQLRKYDLEIGEKIHYQTNTSTTEFDFLNKALNEMTDKIHQYFRNQKQFSENAAHELQTPLSIIRSKADLLLQSKQFKNEDLQNINIILQAVERISKINKALVLLSQIENHDFAFDEPIVLNTVINEALAYLDILIENAHLHIEIQETAAFKLKISTEWALILIQNILKNAIVHNIENGWIKIQILSNELKIENSGVALEYASEQYFNRFRKVSKTGGTGLGLSIINDIALKTGLILTYTSKEEYHCLSLKKGQN